MPFASPALRKILPFFFFHVYYGSGDVQICFKGVEEPSRPCDLAKMNGSVPRSGAGHLEHPMYVRRLFGHFLIRSLFVGEYAFDPYQVPFFQVSAA